MIASLVLANLLIVFIVGVVVLLLFNQDFLFKLLLAAGVVEVFVFGKGVSEGVVDYAHRVLLGVVIDSVLDAPQLLFIIGDVVLLALDVEVNLVQPVHQLVEVYLLVEFALLVVGCPHFWTLRLGPVFLGNRRLGH